MKGNEWTKGSAKTEKGAVIRLSVTEPKRKDKSSIRKRPTRQDGET